MWLTGFDAPCMHTMYVDKPMKGHGLMQAIARGRPPRSMPITAHRRTQDPGTASSVSSGPLLPWRQGVTARVAKLPTSAVLRTEATDETQGFMKALVGSDDRILGFTMIGAEAGEVMAVVQTAMLADLPYPKLRDAALAHPTMAEGLGSLFSNVPVR
jgi:hypothetical protein